MITNSESGLLLSPPCGRRIVNSRDSTLKTTRKAAANAMAMTVIIAALNATAAPNLTPYQSPGWSDKIVVSRTSGTTTDSASLTTLDFLYIDWAVINNGDQSAGGFYTSLYVDNLFLNSWFTPALNAGFYTFNSDYVINPLNAGTHTVTIWADSLSFIAESNEGDNIFNKTITVNPPSQPNLTPFQPSGWSDKIVVSRTTGTTTDSSSLTTADSLFLDWAIINNGTVATAAPFAASLYVDGVFRVFWNNDPPVNTNTWQVIMDYALGSLSAGTHTLTIVADSGFAIAEGNEADNSYTKTINVVALPEIRIAPTSLTFNASSTNRPIFVEIDWMEDSTHSHRPSQAVLDKIVQTFAAEGFTIHLELSDAIPHQDLLALVSDPSTNTAVSSAPVVQAIRNQYFNHINDSRYYYSIWCHRQSLNGGPINNSGLADLPGRIHLVSLGNFVNQVGTTANQVGTFIHEFGHNLGQKHGGTDHENFKPNYLSVMNYHYQLDGISFALLSLGFATNTAGLNDFGYSHGTLPDLNENNLNENLGIGLGRAVDWNCNGVSTDVGVAKDIQGIDGPDWCFVNGTRSVLSDFDNWADIVGNIQTSAFSPARASVEPWHPCISSSEYEKFQQQIALLQKARASQGDGNQPKSEVDSGRKDDRPNSPDELISATTFTVFNDGAANLIVSSIALDAPAPWITWWPPAPFTVPPGLSRKVAVYVNYDLAPAVQTTRRLLVQSNDADENPYPNAVFVQTAGGTGGALQLTGLSLSNGVVRFSVTGPAGGNCVVQVSSNLVNWSAFSTNTILPSGSVPVTDNIVPNRSRRFYRAVIP